MNDDVCFCFLPPLRSQVIGEPYTPDGRSSFGYSVALHDDWLVVGAAEWSDDSAAMASVGMIAIYERNTTTSTWDLFQTHYNTIGSEGVCLRCRFLCLSGGGSSLNGRCFPHLLRLLIFCSLVRHTTLSRA